MRIITLLSLALLAAACGDELTAPTANAPDGSATAVAALTEASADGPGPATDDPARGGPAHALPGRANRAAIEPDAWERSRLDAAHAEHTQEEDAGLNIDFDGPDFDPNTLLEGAIAAGYSECENYRMWAAIGAPVSAEARAARAETERP